MSSHQQAQNNSGATYHQTYQYVTTTNDQVLEIPSNINYQLENVIASGGVQYILSDGSILVQKESNKKDPNKNTFRRMIVVNQGDLQQATTIQVPSQQRIVSQPVSNGALETKNIVTTVPAQNQLRSTTQAMTPIGPLTLTAEEYNELLQRRLEKQAETEQHQQQQQQQQVRIVEMPRTQQEVQQQRRVQQVQLQPQMQDHQNIAVQVQKIVQSLEEDTDGRKSDEIHLIEPKIEHDGSTISEGQLQEHSTKSTEGKNAAGRPFACDQCGKKFLLKHHLTTHARVHTGERPHVCIHCGKDFAHKHCLNTHLLLHSTERPYQCKECKKCFTLKHHLLTHSRVHSRDRPFVCQDCGKTFSLKRHLVTHMKFHAGERPYICQTCGESFAQEQHLVMHSRFHGSVDPFVCQDCGATFPRKFQLVNHGKLHGRVPHECTVCGQEFLQKRTLVAHMRQHTDAPHCCLNCGEGFRTKSELTAHQRIVHNIQPPVRSKNAAAASATATSNNSNVHEQAQHIEQQEIDETHFLKQEHHQYETIQTIEDSHGGHTYQTITMVPSSSSPEHKTIRIQQHGGQQTQHVCQQCGSCFNSRETLQMHLRLHTGDKNLVTDLQLLTSSIPGHIFQSQGNTYIEIDGGKYNINGATLVANNSDGSSVPVQIITTSNGQQVIEQVQSISPSMLHQHQSQNEVQLSQQPIVYTTVHSSQDQNQGGTIQIVQQGQVQQQQTQQSQVIVQPQHPKPKTHFCQHCKKGFAAKHGLQMHNKKHPNGECTVRSHVCPQCNRAFLQKNHLMLHQRQHMEQNRGGGQQQQQIIVQQMEVDGIKVEGSETSTIVLEDQEMKESQNVEEASSGENQLGEMRAHNVIIENTSSTVDGKMKPQADGAEMVASTNVETDGGSVGQVD